MRLMFNAVEMNGIAKYINAHVDSGDILSSAREYINKILCKDFDQFKKSMKNGSNLLCKHPIITYAFIYKLTSGNDERQFKRLYSIWLECWEKANANLAKIEKYSKGF